MEGLVKTDLRIPIMSKFDLFDAISSIWTLSYSKSSWDSGHRIKQRWGRGAGRRPSGNSGKARLFLLCALM